MEDLTGIDPLIIQQLRQAAMRGKTASQLLTLWQSAVEAIGKDGKDRLKKTGYFHEAFGWDMRDMYVLAGWQGFGESAWTDEMIDNRMAPLLAEWRANRRSGGEEGE